MALNFTQIQIRLLKSLSCTDLLVCNVSSACLHLAVYLAFVYLIVSVGVRPAGRQKSRFEYFLFGC
jgi:hypothetical protein